MTEDLILIAYKKDSAIYYDTNLKAFMEANLKGNHFENVFLKKSFWDMDDYIKSRNYQAMSGVLIEPLNSVLIFDENKKDDYRIRSTDLEERLRVLVAN